MKKIVFFGISFIFIFSLLFPQTSYASDIDGHWAKYDIEELVNRNIMGGYGEGIYLPNNNVTRAEFTKLILASLNISTKNYDSPFKDVKKDDWYYSSVVTAAKLGLVAGTSPTTFSPNKAITRQDIAVMITRALDMKNIKSIESSELFLDEKTISPYAKPSVKQLQYLGIVAGKIKGPNNKFYFKPLQNSTRAEAAVMLVRMIKAIEQPNKIIRNVTYDYDFTQMVNKQMALSSRPQTDYKGPWYDASQAMVAYYTNSNNFSTDESDIYQFLVLSGSSGITSQKLNEQILIDKGILKGTANAFIRASKAYNVNDIYLISHALLETGNGTSKLATGIEVGLGKDKKPVMVTDKNRKELTAIKKTYNMFGIGAYDHCPNECGSIRAYESGWFTVDEAIFGGAKFINNGYIGAGQDTIYKMRWNPDKPASHQYATDVGWATKQTIRIKKMFEIMSNSNGHPLVFEVPKFKNQPKLTALPTGEARFNVDKKFAGEKASIKINTSTQLQVRSGPHLSFNVVGNELKENDEVTIIGHNTGWYKVRTNTNDGWLPADHLELEKDKKNSLDQASLKDTLLSDDGNNDSLSIATLDINEYYADLAAVTFDDTPMYNEPSIGSTVITELNSGTEIIIVDEQDEWVKIYMTDVNTDTVQTGWILKEYIVRNFSK